MTNLNEQLQIEREKIDIIDTRIVKLLDVRLKTVRNISEIKQKSGMPIFQAGREQNVLERVSNLSKNSDSCVEIFKKVMEESRKFQEGLICR